MGTVWRRVLAATAATSSVTTLRHACPSPTATGASRVNPPPFGHGYFMSVTTFRAPAATSLTPQRQEHGDHGQQHQTHEQQHLAEPLAASRLHAEPEVGHASTQPENHEQQGQSLEQWPRQEQQHHQQRGQEGQPEELAGPGPGSNALAALGLEGVGAWATKRQALSPGLYLVATPIGNLQDITLRALNVLRSVSLVLAEDTRHTGRLLAAYGIRTALASCHEHNEKGRSRQVLARLQANEALALVSDAGMPGISDPGFILVQQAVEAGIRVVPIPGACALVAAVVASGLPTDSFTFCGFLPPKQGARRNRLQSLRSLPSTLVFYAPPHGLRAVLADMVAVLGGARQACVARELTKMHEELFRSTLQEALAEFTRREPRGEICVVVQGCDAATAHLYTDLLRGTLAPRAGAGAGAAPGGQDSIAYNNSLPATAGPGEVHDSSWQHIRADGSGAGGVDVATGGGTVDGTGTAVGLSSAASSSGWGDAAAVGAPLGTSATGSASSSNPATLSSAGAGQIDLGPAGSPPPTQGWQTLGQGASSGTPARSRLQGPAVLPGDLDSFLPPAAVCNGALAGTGGSTVMLQDTLLALLQSGLPAAQVSERVVLQLLQAGLATKAAAREASRLVPGLSRKDAYALALKLAQAAKRTRQP